MLSLYSLDQRHWKRWQSIAGSCQQLLTEQSIAVGNPGTILTDVNTLLGFVGPEGMVSPPLGRGLYLMYLRWEQDSEKPAKCAGTLEVY